MSAGSASPAAPTFTVANLGCKVNRVESDSWAATLLSEGWTRADSGADVCIVNTCAVTAEAERKTRKEINRALSRNPHGFVIVAGCAASLDPAAYEEMSDRVRVLGRSDVAAACRAVIGRPSAGPLSETGAASAPRLRMGEGFPARVGIKVQDGCDNACTFCIVHVARGPARSVPAARCVDEAQAYAEAGVHEIVLTGIDLGAYDSEGLRLPGLVAQLRSTLPGVRLRLSSIEPDTLDGEMAALLASEDGMVCRHLHVPLQSGSTKVLREMGRKYTADEYLHTIEALRDAVPALSLSTDVIVGFPGEEESDFSDTLALARACGFSRIHAFRYSPRIGTPAAERGDQVPADVKAERMRRLGDLADELRRMDALGRQGRTEQVIVESRGRGMSESYYRVKMPDDAERGSLVPVTLRHFDQDGVFSL